MKIIKNLDNLDNKKQLGSNELLFSKERERFKNINNKRLSKINALSKKKNDYVDLKFTVNSSGLETDFSELKVHVAFVTHIIPSLQLIFWYFVCLNSNEGL